MELNKNFVGICGAALIFVTGLAAVRFAAQAAETGSVLRVDSTPLDRDLRSGNSYSPILKKVAPSVVNIYSTKIIRQRVYIDPFFRQFFGGPASEERTSRENALGSGVIVSPTGYILTASHVVEDADEIKVGIGNDSTEYSAKVVGTDPPTDVAILKIEAKNLPAVTLGDSDQLEVGDVVLAVGNPLGVGQTVTRGIISALGRTVADPSERLYQDFIQTDAAINRGNSGGALVDAEGRLIGINDAIVPPNDGSTAITGIGFAIPINMARNVMEGILNGGRVVRGYLGVDSQDIDAGLVKGFGIPNANGALVTFVAPNSPAANGGVLSGDVITAINDKEITGEDNLRVVVSELRPGATVNVKVYRKGTPKTLAVVLGQRSEAAQESVKPGDNHVRPNKADALEGVAVQDLDAQLRHDLRAPDSVAGALVMEVDRSSNSYDAGLRNYDVIMEINHQPVANADDAVRLCKAARTEVIVVKLWHPDRSGGRIRFLSVDNTKRAQ